MWESKKGDVIKTAFPGPLLEIVSFAPCASFSLLWQAERTDKQAVVFNFSLFLAKPSFMVSQKSAMYYNVCVAFWISSLSSELCNLTKKSWVFYNY